MRAACGKCGGTFDGQMLCPNCGVQLDDTGEGPALSQVVPAYNPAEGDEPTSFPRKLAIGTLCALGLYQGFKHTAAAGLLATSADPEITTEALLGAIGLAVFLTTVLLGTANRAAELSGFTFGIAATGAYFLPDVIFGEFPPPEWLIGLPVLGGLVGGIGGLVGRVLIPPSPKLPTFGLFDSRAFAGHKPPLPPMHWIRLMIAAAAIVGGAYWADEIRMTLAKGISGAGAGLGAQNLVCWMIAMIAALLGGVGAAANTRAGLRQGLGAGVFAAAGIIVAFSSGGLTTFPVAEFWMDQLNVNGGGPLVFAALAVSTVATVVVGGGLGSAVFPPRRR
jgi:hypothetical protein